jgi:predicted NAD/FAD-dependent oxidoreductase
LAGKVTVTVLDNESLLDHELKQMVYGDLKEWFGSQVDLWELIKIYHIENALPQQSQFPIPQVEYLSEQNLLFCGDYQHFASINSAVKSGESAANKIISQLK